MSKKPTKIHPDISKEFGSSASPKDSKIQADPSEFYDHHFKPYKGHHPYIKQGINAMKNLTLPKISLPESVKKNWPLALTGILMVVLVINTIAAGSKLTNAENLLGQSDAQIVVLKADISSLTETANEKIKALTDLVESYEDQIQMVSDSNGSTSVLSPDQVDIVWSPEYIMTFDISDCRYLRFGEDNSKLKLKCMPNGKLGEVSML